MDINKLHPRALAAAIKGGTDGWGKCQAQPSTFDMRSRCARLLAAAAIADAASAQRNLEWRTGSD